MLSESQDYVTAHRRGEPYLREQLEVDDKPSLTLKVPRTLFTNPAGEHHTSAFPLAFDEKSMANIDQNREPARHEDTPGIVKALIDLDRALTTGESERALTDIAVLLGMPMIAWAPDISRPMFNVGVDTFLRKAGWSDEVMDLWWSRSVMLKNPIYIRCRTTSMPFVSSVETGRTGMMPELRRMANLMEEAGVRSLLTVPTHLPRGRVSMLSFGGPRLPKETKELVERTRPYLIASAHLFTNKFIAQHGISMSEEERARLTPREWECLRLIAQGHREEEVAKLLNVKRTTIRYHLDNTVRKLGASNRTHAVALAAQLGMLGPVG